MRRRAPNRIVMPRFRRCGFRLRFPALRRFAAGLAVALAAAVAVPVLAEQGAIVFQIGTGGLNGTYYPVAGTIARVISQPPGSRPCEVDRHCGVDGLVAAVQTSAGSVENVRAVQAGRLDSAFAQADIAYAAFNGRGLFRDSGPLDKLRALASLYREDLQVVVRNGAGIHRVEDLRGRRVSLNVQGSGTLEAARQVLEMHDLAESDLKPVYRRLGPSASLMRDGALDAVIVLAGTPTPAVSELTAAGIARLIPIDAAREKRLQAAYPFFVRSRVEDGSYAGVKGVDTVAIGAQWLVTADLPEPLAYRICRVMWRPSSRAILRAGHDRARHIRLDSALDGIAIPLHPGAARCYRDLGVLD